jgi:arginine N-succinyltransferase
MDYPSIERLSVGRSRSFIAALMPSSPIYVSLLPEQAQWAIGQLHPVGELPFSILIDEGFDPDTYVDVYDGGPIVQARAAMLKSFERSRTARAVASAAARPRRGRARRWHLVSTTRREDFRATCVLGGGDGPPPLARAALDALGIEAGDLVRHAPLDVAVEERA